MTEPNQLGSNQIDTSQYRVPGYLRNAHLQTMLNSQGPRKWRARRILGRLDSQSLVLVAEDGTRLLAELDRAHGAGSTALVVLIHGWEGSSRSSYLVTTAAELLAQGFDVLRINLRDHGDSHHLNPELFNSTRSPEVASALQGFIDERDYQRLFLVGFSLGGNFVLRIAADRGGELGVNACVAICPPTDPARAMDALNNGFFVYENYFFRRWRDSLRRKLDCFPEHDYANDLARAKTLDDLNRLLIPRHTIYDRVEDYFAAYALVGERLSTLVSPAYLIAAQDDPIIPVDDLARIEPIELLHIETCRFGGHCGFLQNLAAHSWAEDRILQILQQHR